MALNSSGYTSSATGVAADSNQTWTLAAGNDANGNPYFTNGQTGANLRYAFYSSNVNWTVGATLLVTPFDYIAGSTPVTVFPLTGWYVFNAVAPVPTFTANTNTTTTTAGKSRITTCIF